MEREAGRSIAPLYGGAAPASSDCTAAGIFVERLDVADQNQTVQELLAVVETASNADPMAEQRLGIQAFGKGKIGQGLAARPDQGVELLAPVALCRRLDQSLRR